MKQAIFSILFLYCCYAFTPPDKAHYLVETSFIESLVRLDASQTPCGVLDDKTCVYDDLQLSLLYLRIYPDYVFMHDDAFIANKDIFQRLTLAGLHFYITSRLTFDQQIVIALLIRFPQWLNMNRSKLKLKDVSPQILAQEIARFKMKDVSPQILAQGIACSRMKDVSPQISAQEIACFEIKDVLPQSSAQEIACVKMKDVSPQSSAQEIACSKMKDISLQSLAQEIACFKMKDISPQILAQDITRLELKDVSPQILAQEISCFEMKDVPPQILDQEFARFKRLISEIPWSLFDSQRLVYLLDIPAEKFIFLFPLYQLSLRQEEKTESVALNNCILSPHIEKQLASLPSQEQSEMARKRVCSYGENLQAYLNTINASIETLLQPFIAASPEVAFADGYYALVYRSAIDRLSSLTASNEDSSSSSNQDLRKIHIQTLITMSLVDHQTFAEKVRKAYAQFIKEVIERNRWDVAMGMEITTEDSLQFHSFFEQARRQGHANFRPFGIVFYYPELARFLNDLIKAVKPSEQLPDALASKQFILNIISLGKEKPSDVLLDPQSNDRLSLQLYFRFPQLLDRYITLPWEEILNGMSRQLTLVSLYPVIAGEEPLPQSESDIWLQLAQRIVQCELQSETELVEFFRALRTKPIPPSSTRCLVETKLQFEGSLSVFDVLPSRQAVCSLFYELMGVQLTVENFTVRPISLKRRLEKLTLIKLPPLSHWTSSLKEAVALRLILPPNKERLQEEENSTVGEILQELFEEQCPSETKLKETKIPANIELAPIIQKVVELDDCQTFVSLVDFISSIRSNHPEKKEL